MQSQAQPIFQEPSWFSSKHPLGTASPMQKKTGLRELTRAGNIQWPPRPVVFQPPIPSGLTSAKTEWSAATFGDRVRAKSSTISFAPTHEKTAGSPVSCFVVTAVASTDKFHADTPSRQKNERHGQLCGSRFEHHPINLAAVHTTQKLGCCQPTQQLGCCQHNNWATNKNTRMYSDMKRCSRDI